MHIWATYMQLPVSKQDWIYFVQCYYLKAKNERKP